MQHFETVHSGLSSEDREPSAAAGRVIESEWRDKSKERSVSASLPDLGSRYREVCAAITKREGDLQRGREHLETQEPAVIAKGIPVDQDIQDELDALQQQKLHLEAAIRGEGGNLGDYLLH